MIRLAYESLKNRWVTAMLTVLCIAISVAMLLGVEKLRRDGRTAFANTISGTDLIVGTRGGGVQLLLYSVFRIGNATSNVSWASYERIAADRRVAWTVPLSLGDSYRGFRVLGTNNDYFRYMKFGQREAISFQSGAPFANPLDAVIGSRVAARLALRMGDEIVLAHGEGDIVTSEHADKPFRITGVLNPTGTPIDQTVHVGLDGLELIHEDWDSPLKGLTKPRDHDHDHAEPDELTAFLVGIKRKPQLFSLQREINTARDDPMQAVIPGIALQQLWDLFGVAESVLRVISWLVLATGLASLLIVILSTLQARRREMAVLRSVGATPMNLLGLFLSESALLAGAGIVLGVSLLIAGLLVLRPFLAGSLGLTLPVADFTASDGYLLIAVLLTALVAGLIPAWRAMRLSLADGLSVRL